jgi:hypothetical protein
MWERWRKGESLQQIAQLFDRNHLSVHDFTNLLRRSVESAADSANS